MASRCIAPPHYRSIVVAACCANCTSQNGRIVPIASVPISASARPLHESQPTCAFSDSLTAATAVFAVFALVVGRAATAVAAPPPASRPEARF
ncbi:MAG: hypothetical protein WCD86_13560, partial [Ktedonobacteraceae bacterium]